MRFFYHFRLLVILDKFPIIGIFFTAYFLHLESEWEKKIGENCFIQKPNQKTKIQLGV
jgi:hypothetical protein